MSDRWLSEKSGNPDWDNRARIFNKNIRLAARRSLKARAAGRKTRKRIEQVERRTYGDLIFMTVERIADNRKKAASKARQIAHPSKETNDGPE